MNWRQTDVLISYNGGKSAGWERLELLEIIKKNHPQTVSLILTSRGTIEDAVKAIKAGAFDYLVKPVVDDELRMVMQRALNQQSLLSENENLRLAACTQIQSGKHHQPELQNGKNFRAGRGCCRQQNIDTYDWAIGNGKKYAGAGDSSSLEQAK